MQPTKRGRPKKIAEEKYVISLQLGGKTLVGKGATTLEALRNIPVPEKIVGKGIIEITHGDKKKEMLFMPARLKRLFYPNAQPILVKWLSLGI